MAGLWLNNYQNPTSIPTNQLPELLLFLRRSRLRAFPLGKRFNTRAFCHAGIPIRLVIATTYRHVLLGTHTIGVGFAFTIAGNFIGFAGS